jgi:hypothetical protein
LIQTAKENFLSGIEFNRVENFNQNVIINHDIHYQTAYNLTNYMLDYMNFTGWSTSVTLGECLGDPPENWYRNASGAPDPSLLVCTSRISGHI